MSKHDADRSGLPAELPGLDLVGTMAKVNLNPHAYRRLLVDFHNRYLQAGERIAQSLGEGDRNAAQEIAHALKGAAGNLGAQALFLASQRLEAALGHEDRGGDGDAFQTFEAALGVVMGGLAGLEKLEEEVEASGEIDPLRRGALLRELVGLVKEGNLASEKLLPELRSHLEGSSLALFAVLKEQIDGFQFFEAEATLTRLMDEVEGST